jgi:hypothetical protein
MNGARYSELVSRWCNAEIARGRVLDVRDIDALSAECATALNAPPIDVRNVMTGLWSVEFGKRMAGPQGRQGQ